MLSLAKLLISLSMQINECVDEVWNACANIYEVDEFVFEVKVESVGHGKDIDFFLPNQRA